MKFEKRDAPGAAPEPNEDKDSGNKPVVVYIMILFIAAFLLMALSFFMHQRSNNEALGELQNSVSNMQQVQVNQEKIIDLQDQLALAEEKLEEVRDELDRAQDESEAAQQALRQRADALDALYTLQQQYLTGDYAGCAQTIADAEDAGLPNALDGKSSSGVTAPSARWTELKDAVNAKLGN